MTDRAVIRVSGVTRVTLCFAQPGLPWHGLVANEYTNLIYCNELFDITDLTMWTQVTAW